WSTRSKRSQRRWRAGTLSAMTLQRSNEWAISATSRRLQTRSRRTRRCGSARLVERAIQVVRGADERQVSERLRVVAERFTGAARLLGVQPEVIGVAEHPFEQEARFLEHHAVGAPRARQGFDEPERAHVERPLARREPVGAPRGVVSVHK